jgi:HPt (histidine-containing phosphotransfer) domain-containing protein
MSTMTSLILDRNLVADIRRIEQATGRHGIFSGCVQKLEENLADFAPTFSACLASGDIVGASRAAHTLKGSCRQLGAQALGDLFADIERWAKAGDYEQAKRTFEGGASLVAESIEALRSA